MDESNLPVVRQWPPDEDIDPNTALAAECSGCGSPWRIHPDLAGFRVRCSCGTYVEAPRLPPPAPATDLFEGKPDDLPVAKITKDDQGRLDLPLKKGEVTDREMPISAAMAPGTVQHGSVGTQQRWTNAAFLELALFLAAFLLPQVIIKWSFDGDARALAMPFGSLVTGIAVVIIAAATSPFAFSGMRLAPARFFLEAVAVAGVTLVLAMWWMQFVDAGDESGAMLRALRDGLGYGWFLFVLAFCPAVFEEIAFRGAVQGRFCALLGRFQGLIATAAAFGLAHGVTAALPFHVGIGVYLCFLRERSKSLLPCMLMHGLYNAAIGILS